MKKDFKDFLKEKEEENLEKQLQEDAATVIGSILGYSTAGLLAAFGGSLLAYGGVKGIKGIVGIWKKIFKTAKTIGKDEAENISKNIRTDAKVQQEKENIEQKSDKFEQELKNVYLAIAAKDFARAKEEFQNLDKTFQNNPDVQKAIIAAITKELKMPPIYLASPGSLCYQKIKQILGIKIARAAAEATKIAMENQIK